MEIKFCAVILSYGTVPYLKRAIESVKPLKTFILNPNESWWSKNMVDKTEEMCYMGDVEIIRADLKDEREARNYTIKFCKERGFDYVITLDSDEVLDDLEFVMGYLKARHQDPTSEAYCVELIDYYPDENTPLPKRGHCPIIAIDLRTNNEFYDKRCFRGDWEVISETYLHHYSFLIPNEYKFKLESPLYDDAYPPPEYEGIIKL